MHNNFDFESLSINSLKKKHAMNIENLDHDEVNKFDELAARWWDKNGEFKPLHQINPLRVGLHKREIQH